MRTNATRVVLGIAWILGASRGAFAVSGTLDPGFGTGGTVVTPTNGNGGVNAVLSLTHNGVVDVILAAGKDGGNVAVARYDGGGTIVPAFGGGDTGVASIFAANGGAAQAMALRSDGYLLVTGGANGFLSTILDGAGGHTTPVITTAANGKSLFWGYGLVPLPGDDFMSFGQGNADHCTLVRYASDAQFNIAVDTTFATNGAADAGRGSCFAMVQDGSGFIVSAETGANGHHGFGIERLTGTGTVDTGYGTNGIATLFEDSLASVRALVRQPDGKIVAVGKAGGLGTPVSLVVARFNTNGTPDGNFGQGGGIALGLPGTSIGLVANAVVLEQPSGNIIVGGAATAPGNVKDGAGRSVFLIFRFLPDGTPDQSFGPDAAGLVLTGFGTGVDSEIRALTIQSDGKLLAAGNACPTGLCGLALARYLVSPPGSTSTTTTTGASSTTTPGQVPTTVTVASSTTTLGPSCEQPTPTAALACLCAAGLAPATCTGEPVPPAVGKDFTRACSMLAQAASASPGRKTHRRYLRARTLLTRAAAITRRAAKRRKHALGGACVTDLQTILTSGRTLVGGVLASE